MQACRKIDVLDVNEPLRAVLENQAKVRCCELTCRMDNARVFRLEELVSSKAHDKRLKHILRALPVLQRLILQGIFNGCSD